MGPNQLVILNKLAIGLKVSSPSTAIRSIEVDTLTPDQLLDLLAEEGDSTS
jgi:hypothetical protein